MKLIFLYLIIILIGLNRCTLQDGQKTSSPVLLQSVHPMYLQIPVPSGGIEVRSNPPILRWPYEKGKDRVYEIRLSQDSTFNDESATISAKTPMALVNPHQKLENGTWYWQYKSAGSHYSETFSFHVSGRAIPIVAPEPAELIGNIPEEHPRVLAGKNEIAALRLLGNDTDAKAIIAEAKEYLGSRIPKEAEAYPKRKLDHPGQQKKLEQDASQNLSSQVYEKILLLTQAFILTGDEAFAGKAIAFAAEISSWDPDGITRLSDFGDARCMLGMALVFDTFYDTLDEGLKGKLLKAISQRADRFYRSWINHIESKVLSGHVWQHILHYFFQTALALQGEIPQAGDWLVYAYELFIARAPVLGGFDGGWVEGVSYFKMNMETILDIPLFIKKLTGFDFITAHPWYRENIRWIRYHIPPGSSADGFGDNTEEVFGPGAAYIAYAGEMAKLTGDPLAAGYVRECRKFDNPDLSGYDLLRWIRLTKTRHLPFPKDDLPNLPMGAVFQDIGLASAHSDLSHPENNLMLAFKSSPYGAYGHMLCEQNTFNILYGGKRFFFRTGYKITMDDPHRTGWYRATKSQNGILVDGQGEPYSSEAFGWIARFMCNDEMAYIKGDATNAYKSAKDSIDPGVEKAFRHMVLAKPDLIVLYDELEAGREVEWSWLIHAMENMEIDPGRQSFSTTLPHVTGIGKVYSGEKVKWELTDTFDVKAVNWRQSRHPDGTLKRYDDVQWHLKLTTPATRSVRFLSVWQISPDASAEQVVCSNPPDDNGDITITVGTRNISANLNTSSPPKLIIEDTASQAAFSAYSDKVTLNGKKLNGKHPDNSVLAGRKNSRFMTEECGDSLPHAMENIVLFENSK